MTSMLAAQGGLDEAGMTRQQGTVRYPNDPSARGNLAIAHACLEQWDEAIVAYHALLHPAIVGKPKAKNIAVAIPVYNTKVGFLHECLESIYQQTLLPETIIVIDDGSTDPATLAYLRVLARCRHCTVISNVKNLSLGPSMNNVLRFCDTDFVLKLDSDDRARPRLVEEYDNYIRHDPNVDVLGCQMQQFGLSNEVSQHPECVTKDYVVSSPGYWFINHTGILLNRKSILDAGGYRSLRGFAEDYELWVRMIFSGHNRFRNLQQVLLDYRAIETGLHATQKRLNRVMLSLLKLAVRAAPSF